MTLLSERRGMLHLGRSSMALKGLVLPCLTVLVAIAADQILPLSLEEEKQQSE